MKKYLNRINVLEVAKMVNLCQKRPNLAFLAKIDMIIDLGSQITVRSTLPKY